MLVSNIMQVLKNLFGLNKKISASEIAIKKDNKGVPLDSYLSDSTIYDSGSNSNGEWIRFNNGWMIIKQKYSDTKNVYVAMGSLKRVGLNIPPDFPIAFKETPNVQITLHNCWLVWLMGIEGEATTTNATGNNLIPVASAETRIVENVEIHITAIGKWK